MRNEIPTHRPRLLDMVRAGLCAVLAVTASAVILAGPAWLPLEPATTNDTSWSTAPTVAAAGAPL